MDRKESVMKSTSDRTKAFYGSGLVLLFVFTFVGQAMAQSCVEPPAGLISWWAADGNADDIADGNHGTLVGGATFATGEVEEAFLLDGIDDFVDAGNAPNLHVSGGDFTVDAWVRFNAITGPGGLGVPPGDMAIVDKMLSGSSPLFHNLDGWRLLKQDDNRFYFCLGGGSLNRCGDPAYTVFSTTPAVVGEWFHVAAVKSFSSFAIYVNGVQEDIRSPVPSFLDTNSVNLRFGSHFIAGVAGNPTSFLNGLIDEVEIFNRALTAEEIAAIYNSGSAGKCKANNPPVAVDDSYSADEDTTLAVAPPGVLGNDSDPNGDPITAVLVSGSSNGLLTLNSDGSFTYTPNANFSGLDSFIYKANDGSLDSNMATVTISVNQVNDAPVASADGPYLGVTGIPVDMDASTSSDEEGAPLTFAWDFGDGSTLVTTQPSITHTYANLGTFTVTLVVNDGQLNSVPFTTQATIGDPGGGQRENVDAFLSYVSPTQPRTDLPVGTTSFDVAIIYGPTILPDTFQAELNGAPFLGFTPVPGTSETVTIPLSSGRNILLLLVDGVRFDGRTATDRDRLTFIVP
jgi:VCBS repeat-containing protein